MTVVTGMLLLCGCRMGVPIHVWQPPLLDSTVGRKVVLQSVAGPKRLVEPIKQQLLDNAPVDLGRATTLVSADQLPQQSLVALASATTDEPSDVALAAAARQAGVDFLLRGEILDRKLDEPDPVAGGQSVARGQPPPGATQPAPPPAPDRLTLSWRLTPVGKEGTAGGMPMVVDLQTAIDRYPDLALLGEPDQVLVGAAARETYRLITPSVERQQVQLAIPYGLPGSREVRQGNLAAARGKWGEATQLWQAVAQAHPWQAAAFHNLALAAVAGQDYSQAKELARRAIRLQPTPLHKQTLVWIELRQREYHRAFKLPDPPEGWFMTQAVAED